MSWIFNINIFQQRSLQSFTATNEISDIFHNSVIWHFSKRRNMINRIRIQLYHIDIVKKNEVYYESFLYSKLRQIQVTIQR